MIGFEILNLKHRDDRRERMAGNLITQDVPYENITFHEAIYGAAYQDAKAACDAAVADGFFAFSKDCEMGGPGDVAYHWGVMRILRHIASAAYPFEFGYFNQDDRLLPRDFDYQDFIDIANIFKNIDPNFLFLQMGWDYTFFDMPKVSIDTEDMIVTFCNRLFYRGVFAKGDSGLLISKRGAQFLIDRFTETKQWFEILILEAGDVPGVYALWNPLRFKPMHLENTVEDRIQVNDPNFRSGSVCVHDAFKAAATDKEWLHRYGVFYELLLTTLYHEKQKPLKVLELGVYQGASMRLFSELPMVEKYVGINALDELTCAVPDNCDYIQAEAYWDETLRRLQSTHGEFDLIIDDADHSEENCRFFFEKYRSLVKDNGVLIYEEFNPDWGFINDLRHQDARFFDFRLNLSPENRAEYKTVGRNTDSIIAYKRIGGK